MIRVLENGKYRVITCSCGCKYSFDLTDVEDSKVKCPECRQENTILEQEDKDNEI